MCCEGLARHSRRVRRSFLRGSHEISLAPSLHRASIYRRSDYGYKSLLWQHSARLGYSLEKVQKFALRMVTQGWDMNYTDLLDKTGVLSLQSRREVARLCLLYKIVNCLCYFDLNVFSVRTGHSYHSHSLSLIQPFSRTNSFFHSFVPFTISLWNSLNSSLCSETSFISFKRQLTHLCTHGSHVSY